MTADPHLIQQARSSDPDARQKAAYLVSHSSNDRDYPLMFELLGDKDWRVRKTIVDGFVRDPSDLVIDGLLEAIGDSENAGRRNSATEALMKIGDVGTVPFLLKIIAEEDKLNLTALRALVRIAEASRPRIVEQAERSFIQRKFRESFPAAKIEPLIGQLHATGKREVKTFILKFLGWSADPRALPVLLGSLEEPDSAEVAAQALIDFGPQALPSILQTLHNAEEDEV